LRRRAESMTDEMFSVERVAERLGLHVRTVRNYIRDGRLKAVRIGKQYRIAREHLEALTGISASAAGVGTEAPRRHVEVSSIVQIEAISFDAASRVTNALMAATKGRPEGDEPLRIDTVYDKERARLKVILSGGIDTTVSLLKFITAYLKS
jgi:excisionase family DNA binding protein